MEKIVLSYVMTTFNKLAYLQVTLPLLIEGKRADEEIIIIDGGSTDGSVEYLQKLFEEHQINQFLSEKDFGEAHGTNKGFLAAKGELIKIITDDDVFHYPSIYTCREFMLKDRTIDILGFDGFGFNINHSAYSYKQIDYVKGFHKWKATKTPFLFCGLSFMIRRSSLAYLGLFNVNFKIVDIEYAIRVSSLKSKIAFYTGLGYVNIVNPQSNSHKFYEQIAREKKTLAKLYPSFKNKINYKSSIVKLKDLMAQFILRKPLIAEAQYDYKNIVAEGIEKLNEYNTGKTFTFLT